MPQEPTSQLSRRSLLQTTGTAAAVTAISSPLVGAYAGEDNTIQVALIGCGGRGTGAAANALSTYGPIKLVAMADVFEDKLNNSYRALSGKFNKDDKKSKKPASPGKAALDNDTSGRVDVPIERRFIGFEAYKQAIDCLKPGDVAIFTTPLAFRWVHFSYAIEKGINVFMEKPVTADGPTSRRMLELNEKAKAKNLKVAVGLMCRHCAARQELFDRIQNGEIGDITLLRAYRMTGPTASAFSKANDGSLPEVMYQIRRFHSFLWASGGAVSDFMIHNIDESCWMKNEWPVEAQALGGRHYRMDYVDQNFDSYSIEFTFADGTKMLAGGRGINGCHKEFASYAHGTKGSAIISTASHSPAKCRIYKGHNMTDENLTWAYPPNEPNPYQLEWDHLIDAIRKDTPYNEVQRGVEASVVTSMGRMAAHTGKVITFDQFMNSDHEFAPNADQITPEGEAPLKEIAPGKYPIPMPGLVTKREY